MNSIEREFARRVVIQSHKDTVRVMRVLKLKPLTEPQTFILRNDTPSRRRWRARTLFDNDN